MAEVHQVDADAYGPENPVQELCRESMAVLPPAGRSTSALELDGAKPVGDGREIGRGHHPELTGSTKNPDELCSIFAT
jgi:hypothetical protein